MPDVKLTSCVPADGPGKTDLGERYSFDCVATVSDLSAWTIDYRMRLWRDEAATAQKPYRWIITALSIDAGTSGAANWPDDQVTRDLLAAIPLDGLRAVVQEWLLTGARPFGPTVQALGIDYFAPWLSERKRYAKLLVPTLTAHGRRGRPRTVWTDDRLRELAERAIALGIEYPTDWRRRLAAEFATTKAQRLDEIGNWISPMIRDARSRLWLSPSLGQGKSTQPRPGPRMTQYKRKKGSRP